MRIAFDARSLATAALRGWDRYTLGLAGALARPGLELVLLHRAGHAPPGEHVAGLDADLIGIGDRGGVWWEQVALPRALDRLAVDVYHAPAEHGVPFRARQRSVLTIHSVTAHSYAHLVRCGTLPGTPADYLGPHARPGAWTAGNAYWHLQARGAAHVLTPSEFARAEVVRFLRIPPERVTVTPLAVARQFLEPPRSADEREATLQRLGVRQPFILYVGGYERHKNVAGTLRAAAALRRERPEVSLVTVGTKGVAPDLQEMARALGLVPGRDLVPLADLTTELPDLYDEAAVFLSLSWRESFGLPALEALARGLPAVVSAWGAAPEVLGDAATFVDPRDPESAARAVLERLDPDQRERRRAHLRRRAERFSWDDTARRTLEVYRRVVAA